MKFLIFLLLTSTVVAQLSQSRVDSNQRKRIVYYDRVNGPLPKPLNEQIKRFLFSYHPTLHPTQHDPRGFGHLFKEGQETAIIAFYTKDGFLDKYRTKQLTESLESKE